MTSVKGTGVPVSTLLRAVALGPVSKQENLTRSPQSTR